MTDISGAADYDDAYFTDEIATFGDRLAAAREAVGFSQDDLAARLGVLGKTIRKWEEDRAEPRANKLQMLAGVLNVSMPWLLSGEGEGLDADALPQDGTLRDILSELRVARAESIRLTEKLGRLEKRIRTLSP